MAVTLTVLGSGSKGNCAVLSSSRTQVLVDAGFSCRETFRRMKDAGLEPENTDAILITHEHSDHIKGVEVLARKLDVPVYMTEPTYQEWRYRMRCKLGEKVALSKWERFASGRRFTVGDIEVFPFTINHDAVDPVAFRFSAEGAKLAIVTDLGRILANVMDAIAGCDMLMIESNHDSDMLRNGPYPPELQRRIAGPRGHLSNERLGHFLASDYDGGAAYLILGHLSEQNNMPAQALMEATRALRQQGRLERHKLLVASQHQPTESIRM